MTMEIHDGNSGDFPHPDNRSVQVKWSVRRKIYECVRCGYDSDRKSNVARHFRRFHIELDQYKICICKKKFTTKGEYYEHCNKIHRHLRHTWYINTLNYKCRKIKTKTMKIEISESTYKSRKCSKKRALRCSARLQTLYSKKRILKDEKPVIGNDISIACNMKKSASEIEENKENRVVKVEFKFNGVRDKINQNTDVKPLKHLPELHRKIAPAHLPLKKRFGNFLKRKCLVDIKNFNNNDMQSHNQNFAKIDEQQRAFISQIDFDELNAILNLVYLRG